MRIALYIVAALVAIFLAYYLFGLISAGLMVLWQVLLIAAVIAVAVVIVGGVLRGRRALPLAASKANVPQTVKAQEKAEKKAERSAEKELRALEASLGKETTTPTPTVPPPTTEETIQKTRRR